MSTPAAFVRVNTVQLYLQLVQICVTLSKTLYLCFYVNHVLGVMKKFKRDMNFETPCTSNKPDPGSPLLSFVDVLVLTVAITTPVTHRYDTIQLVKTPTCATHPPFSVLVLNIDRKLKLFQIEIVELNIWQNTR